MDKTRSFPDGENHDFNDFTEFWRENEANTNAVYCFVPYIIPLVLKTVVLDSGKICDHYHSLPHIYKSIQQFPSICTNHDNNFPEIVKPLQQFPPNIYKPYFVLVTV